MLILFHSHRNELEIAQEQTLSPQVLTPGSHESHPNDGVIAVMEEQQTAIMQPPVAIVHHHPVQIPQADFNLSYAQQQQQHYYHHHQQMHNHNMLHHQHQNGLMLQQHAHNNFANCNQQMMQNRLVPMPVHQNMPPPPPYGSHQIQREDGLEPTALSQFRPMNRNMSSQATCELPSMEEFPGNFEFYINVTKAIEDTKRPAWEVAVSVIILIWSIVMFIIYLHFKLNSTQGEKKFLYVLLFTQNYDIILSDTVIHCAMIRPM